MDMDGWVTTKQIAVYLTIQVDEKHSSLFNWWRFVASQIIHASTVGTVFFACASTISASINLVKRVYGTVIFTTISSPLLTWCSLIGSLLFVWSFLCRTVQELKGDQNKSWHEKIILLLRRNIASLGQIINYLWLLESIAYLIADKSSVFWLIGGLCYFVGGLLAVSACLRMLIIFSESFSHASL